MLIFIEISDASLDLKRSSMYSDRLEYLKSELILSHSMTMIIIIQLRDSIHRKMFIVWKCDTFDIALSICA